MRSIHLNLNVPNENQAGAECRTTRRLCKKNKFVLYCARSVDDMNGAVKNHVKVDEF